MVRCKAVPHRRSPEEKLEVLVRVRVESGEWPHAGVIDQGRERQREEVLTLMALEGLQAQPSLVRERLGRVSHDHLLHHQWQAV